MAVLQVRDQEILRTLGRLRYVTTPEIVTTFFSLPSGGRWRLSALAEMGLITAHSKGLPIKTPYKAWRLTQRGLEKIGKVFPDEDLPDGLVDRLGETSLSNLDHREATNQLYLAFLRLGVANPEATDRDSLRRNAEWMRARANQIAWQPDGDVVLAFDAFGENQQIVPDATILGRRRPVLVFVEVDRSTRSLRRISENLERYRVFFRDIRESVYPKMKPALLYVVRSETRREGIAHQAREILDQVVTWDVSLEGDAVAWLDKMLVDHSDAALRSARSLAAPKVGLSPGAPSASQTRPGKAAPSTVQDELRQLFGVASELYRHYRRHLGTCPAGAPSEDVARLQTLYGELSHFAARVA